MNWEIRPLNSPDEQQVSGGSKWVKKSRCCVMVVTAWMTGNEMLAEA